MVLDTDFSCVYTSTNMLFCRCGNVNWYHKTKCEKCEVIRTIMQRKFIRMVESVICGLASFEISVLLLNMK